MSNSSGVRGLLETWVGARLHSGKKLPLSPSSPESPLYPFVLEGLPAGAPHISQCRFPRRGPCLCKPCGVYGWHSGWASSDWAAVAGCRTSSNSGNGLLDG